MKILLSYSKDHFDPEKSPSDNKYWGSSASILAKSLYEILSKIGQVTYIDKSEKNISGETFDLFLGIAENFLEITQNNTIRKSVLFAVNMHPYQRNRSIKKFMNREKIAKKSLAGYELTENFNLVKAIDKADHILCVGNNEVYNSYVKNGVSRKKIKMINYAGFERNVPGKMARKAKINYIHVASEIGIRKGFDIVFNLFTNPSFINSDFHLDIIGNPTSLFYQKKLDLLQKTLGEKITYHGWIDSKNNEYAQILSRNDFLIYPALEEGQAGTALEAIQLGVIPLITTSTGIDFSPLGIFEPKAESQPNFQLLEKSYSLSESQIEHYKSKTLEYYREFHSPFTINLSNSINDIVSNFLYPKVSIVLSIFNKEDTITQLLELLSSACLEYGNAEIQIIFDGCEDKTEQITKNFFKKRPGQVVHYHKTDNVWEVKSNNLGLRNANGKYTIIVQDDNYIYDKYFIFEAVQFLEKNPTAVILGGLAGVNFYPKGTILPNGPGQITSNENEVYWRQDEKTDPSLKNCVFEVDACMRGPLFIRKSFLEEHGYLDEVYAPLYNDDMDICFRAKSKGYKVYCMLMDVENKNGTIGKYDQKKTRFFEEIIARNTAIFYSRWKPSAEKDYSRIMRVIPLNKGVHRNYLQKKFSSLFQPFSKIFKLVKKVFKIIFKNIRDKGVITGSRKTISDFIKIYCKYSPYISYKLTRLARKIHSTPDDIETTKREEREKPWYYANGDETFRLNYNLTSDSLVIDVGGYKGDWASAISNKFGANIHIFEPVVDYALKIKQRFRNNNKIFVHSTGLGHSDEKKSIYIAEGGTSLIKTSEQTTDVKILDVHKFIESLNIEMVDLIKINIEGAEYDLLNRIIETGDIKKINNLQIQFHDFAPDAKNRMKSIQDLLQKTHHLTYQYEFVWENWELND